MRTFLILVLLSFSNITCLNTSNEKRAKSISDLDDMKKVSRKPTCFVKNRDDFRKLVKAMEAKHYFPLRLSKWPHWYKNHINDKLYSGTEVFVELPLNTKWKGKENTIEAPEQIVIFKDAIVTEIVLKGEGDVKIVQFLFSSNNEAEEAISKMKLISAYTISTRGLKNPNYYFIKDCAIYFVRVRAAAFNSATFREIFEEKHGKVKILRW